MLQQQIKQQKKTRIWLAELELADIQCNIITEEKLIISSHMLYAK